jgi:hypothetical protein
MRIDNLSRVPDLCPSYVAEALRLAVVLSVVMKLRAGLALTWMA